MPPALSDNESGPSTSDNEIPFRAKDKGKGKAVTPPADEEDSGEEAEDEYAIEKILGHREKKGIMEYEVKWLNYDEPGDNTWEPEDNLASAAEVLQEYWEEIGGRPEVSKGKKRKGRKSNVESEPGTSQAPVKRAKQLKEWSPPPGSWEDEVDYVETVEEQYDKNGQPEKHAYIVWKNGKKTLNPLRQLHQKCPQKMLVYYENHLVFTHAGPEDELNGDT